MSVTCKNCHHHFKGKYCYNCGQPEATHKINSHFLWHDVQHGLLHLDKGMGYTVKQLFTRPGNSIREFIEGKRVQHFKPISLVLVLAGIYGLLFHFFHIDVLSDSVTVNGDSDDAEKVRHQINQVSDWISGHYAVVSLAMVPFFATGTYIMFWKTGYNFVEHIVINAFLTGQRLVLGIALFPLYYWLNDTPALKQLGGAVNTATLLLTVWTFFQFFPTLSKGSVLWRSVLSLVISLILFAVAVVASVWVFRAKLFAG